MMDSLSSSSTFYRDTQCDTSMPAVHSTLQPVMMLGLVRSRCSVVVQLFSDYRSPRTVVR